LGISNTLKYVNYIFCIYIESLDFFVRMCIMDVLFVHANILWLYTFLKVKINIFKIHCDILIIVIYTVYYTCIYWSKCHVRSLQNIKYRAISRTLRYVVCSVWAWNYMIISYPWDDQIRSIIQCAYINVISNYNM